MPTLIIALFGLLGIAAALFFAFLWAETLADLHVQRAMNRQLHWQETPPPPTRETEALPIITTDTGQIVALLAGEKPGDYVREVLKLERMGKIAKYPTVSLVDRDFSRGTHAADHPVHYPDHR